MLRATERTDSPLATRALPCSQSIARRGRPRILPLRFAVRKPAIVRSMSVCLSWRAITAITLSTIKFVASESRWNPSSCAPRQAMTTVVSKAMSQACAVFLGCHQPPLVMNRGRAVSRDEFLNEVWGHSWSRAAGLSAEPAQPVHLRTVNFDFCRSFRTWLSTVRAQAE